MRIALLALLILPLSIKAAPDYTYCEITGLAFGANKDFVAAVAARIVDRQGLTGNAACQAIWKDAYATGKRLSSGGKWSELDTVKWQKLQDFETKIIDNIISNLKLGS